MKRLVSILATAALTVSLMPAAAFAQPEPTKNTDYGAPGVDYVEGEAIVMVDGGVKTLKREARSSMGTLSVDDTSFTIEESVNITSESTDAVVVSGESTEELIEDLQALDCVQSAQPNYIYKLTDADVDQAVSTSPAKLSTKATTSDPEQQSGGSTEPMYQYQWALSNTYAGSEGCDLDVKGAWDNGAGSDEEVVVAVIDSGVDYTHEDLKDVMWDKGLDYPELTALGGGKYGVSYFDQDSTDPLDLLGHGTHCSSVIASAWNGVGTAGINGKAKIMAVKMLGGSDESDEYATTAGTIKCFNYVITAKQCGVNVVATSNSWGPDSSDCCQDFALSYVLEQAGEEGIVSVFAAGNNSFDHNYWAGQSTLTSKYVVNVGAMNSIGQAACFSDYGRYGVDLFSPGTSILAATSSKATENGMQGQFTPWLGNDPTVCALEDFESGDLDLDIRCGSTQGDPEIVDEGYCSNKALKLPLAGLKKGDSFCYWIGLPKDELLAKGYNPEDDLHLSAMGGVRASASFHSYFYVLESEEGNWTYGCPLSSYDENWGCVSVSLEGKRCLQSDGSYCYFVLNGTAKADYGENDYMLFDNISVGANASDYYYDDGTSMACPGVTGIISLLSSHNARTSNLQTAEQAAEIVAYVRGGVTESESLSDKCFMGGCANANVSYTAYKTKNVAAVRPVIDSIEAVGQNTYQLNGHFFKAGDGTRLEVDGAPVTISAITDAAITFTADLGSPHMVEFSILRGDGKKSSHSLSTPVADKGYQTLSNASDVKIAWPMGTFSADQAQVVSMTATDKYVYALAYEEGAGNFLLRYDTSAEQWSAIDIPAFNGKELDAIPTPRDASMTAGNGKVYLNAYLIESDDNYQPALLTYDESTGEWLDAVYLCSELEEAPIVYFNGELIAVGCFNSTTEKFTDAHVIDLETGETARSLPDMPITACLGQTVAWNDGIIYAAYSDGSITQDSATAASNPQILVYTASTDSWSTPFDDFRDYSSDGEQVEGTVTDPHQSHFIGLAGTATGAIAYGAVANNGQANMVDTWKLDATDGSISDTDVLFSTARVPDPNAAVCNGSFYAMGHVGLERKAKFGRVSLEALGVGATGTLAEQQLSFGASVIEKTWGDDDFVLQLSKTNVISDVELTSKNPSVATVDQEGKVSIHAVGEAEIVATCPGDAFHAQGAATVTLKVSPRELTAGDVTLEAARFVYDGKAKTPAVTVKVGSTTLKEGTDYKVTYLSNINAGTSKAIVTGTGTYSGKVAKSFTIEKAAQSSATITTNSKSVKAGKRFSLAKKGVKGGAKCTWSKVKGSSKIVVSSSGKVTVKKGAKKGRYALKVKLSVAKTSNYNARKLYKTIKVRVK